MGEKARKAAVTAARKPARKSVPKKVSTKRATSSRGRIASKKSAVKLRRAPAKAPVRKKPESAKPKPRPAARPLKAPAAKIVAMKPVLRVAPKPPAPTLPARPVLVKKLDRDGDGVFRKGDFVVYPAHGVGKVQGIETQEISGHTLQVVTIFFEKDRMILRVPVAKAKNSGLRRLSTRKVMDSAMQALKGRSRIKRAMWSRRAQEYEAKINSGDPVSIAEVVRDLHRNADQPDQSYSERQIYQAALDRLVREVAAIDGTDETQATAKLHSVMKAAA